MELETCLQMPGGKIGHAELKLPDLWLYLSDEFPEMGVRSPKAIGGSPVALTLLIEDIDAVVAKALAAGASQDGDTRDEFHGHRAAKLVDPFGHRWFLQMPIEDISTGEMERRFAKMMEGG